MVHQSTLRIIPAFVLAATVALLMSGCVLVPVGRPAYVAPPAPVVIAPAPPVYGYYPYYGHRHRW